MNITTRKKQGMTYTPNLLAHFVAKRIVSRLSFSERPISILDPAIGDGALVSALLDVLPHAHGQTTINGFDVDPHAVQSCIQKFEKTHPNITFDIQNKDFLDFAFDEKPKKKKFDVIIANPPYVRTQILDTQKIRRIADSIGMSGKIDLYHAFLLGMFNVLAHDGIMGVIIPNRFMMTKSAEYLRKMILKRFVIHEIFDFGDTKLFNAAVLPMVILLSKSEKTDGETDFVSIYETKKASNIKANDLLEALNFSGVVEVGDGRKFEVKKGTLESGNVWRLASKSDTYHDSVITRKTWKRFGDIGKIRVGVKTCADEVFIRNDWDEVFGEKRPELLRPLTTHHVANRFHALNLKNPYEILYPHEVFQGKRKAVPLEDFPKSRAYLERHRSILERRTYVIESGRKWYEIWVPHHPEMWGAPKLVFRDISERPTFWIDFDGTIINGDCYWLTTNEDMDLLWLACAVANSTFSEFFYDLYFNNKLYSGRRRFMAQYVERFPLPDPCSSHTCTMIRLTKEIYANPCKDNEEELDELVWQSFGLPKSIWR